MNTMHSFSKTINPAHTYRMYESQFPGEQTAPLGFFGNDFGGNINNPTLADYTVVGYMNGQLWLQSKTGDSSDSIKINFYVDQYGFDSMWQGKKASFKGKLEWDYVAQGWYYNWTFISFTR